jgi:hypothetical protein
VADLQSRYSTLAPRLKPLADRKSELVAQTGKPGFFDHASVRDATFDELHKLDQFLSRCDRWAEALVRLRLRAQSPASAVEIPALRERAGELESELEQLEFVSQCRCARDLSDTFLVLTRVNAQGAPLEAVETLARMYVSLARRRRFEAQFLAERFDDRSDVAVIQVLGLGAVALFTGEAGLHEFKRRTRVKVPRARREQTHEDTAVIRVELFAVAAEPDTKFATTVHAQLRSLKPARSRLVESANWHATAFHEPTVRSLDLWLLGERAEAQSAALRLLHAQATDSTAPANGDAVIRRYDLGIGSRIKDLRTGRTTTRLAQFFRGQIEMVAPGQTDSGDGR